MFSGKLMAAVVALSLLGGVAPVKADDAAVEAAGRKVLASYERAVVHVTATVKISIQGEMAGMAGEQEKKNELIATVIDPAGLAVCSLAALDPTSAIGNVRVNVGGQPRNIKLKGELSEVKFRLSDGTEVAARIVLKDEDLDLAFIAPETPLADADKGKLAVISLDDSAKDLQLLDPVIFISRLNKNLGYEPSVALGRISAKLTKPRIEYVAGGSPGLPVFNKDGRLVGIVLTHRRSNNDVTAGLGGIQADMATVIVPAADIVEAANQAKEEAKKPSKKAEPAPAPAAEKKE